MRRRSLVKIPPGIGQLPAGDSLAGTQTLRLYLGDSTLARMPLDDNGEVPLLLSSGSASSVPVVGAIHGQ